jgi:hypothetical protein
MVLTGGHDHSTAGATSQPPPASDGPRVAPPAL